MFCSECGTPLPQGAETCPSCGQSVNVAADRSASNIAKPASPFPSGNDPAVLDQIRGWNWGALLSPLVWSFANRLWSYAIMVMLLLIINIVGLLYFDITVGATLLFINIYIHISLGTNGNMLAWQEQSLAHIKQYKDKQRRYAYISGFLVFVWIVLSLICVFTIVNSIILTYGVGGPFNSARESLSGLKTAVEMVAEDNPGTATGTGRFTNAAWGKNNLCNVMLEDDVCTDKAKSEANLEARIAVSVSNFSLTIKSENGKPDSTYVIKGEAKDKWHCKICVTPKGIFPETYNKKDCAAGTCP